MRDRISQQPDEILVQILSLLTTRQAGRTSVLSHRWKGLWKLTTTLVFDSQWPYSQWPYSQWPYSHAQYLEREKFVSWVNRVLTLHESPCLDEFSVRFNVGPYFSDQINEWVNWVARKRVKVLEINLLGSTCLDGYHRSFKSVSNLSSIQCLRSVSLSSVNVDGELLEYFLSNCPHLETLYIAHSYEQLKLKVVGASVKLKNLVIKWCHCESIELSAPKLVMFHYKGEPLPDFHIGSNPLLTELIFSAGCGHKVTSSLVPFSSHLPQLKTLSLSMWIGKKTEQKLPQIPVLRNLKHLILEIQFFKDTSLVRFKKLITAAPCLVKFTLKLTFYMNPSWKPSDSDMIRKPSCQTHECLREEEIMGFVGGFCDLKLMEFLLRNAINLEKILIRQSDRLNKDMIRRLQIRVDVLKRMLPSGTQLVFM